ncbi:hypothetical protein HPB50_011841 [Hyalomma asiaticum]|uniref:Uncharacterized protein n=1 Tax=Hyalomma asiaticum TaxID=266040 RepID=A0ACB7SML7_HYAAI|nr:hypothetical protein HPB50_011841 [Hyalomma asiaticum]
MKVDTGAEVTVVGENYPFLPPSLENATDLKGPSNTSIRAIFMPRQEELRYAYEHAMEVHNLRDPLFGVTTHTEVVDSDDPYQTSKKRSRCPATDSAQRRQSGPAHVDSWKDGGHGQRNLTVLAACDFRLIKFPIRSEGGDAVSPACEAAA